jgi:hypothetical protein
MITDIYGWILNHKNLVIAVCILIVLLLIVNRLTKSELDSEEEKRIEFEKAQKRIAKLSKAKRVDHKALGDEFYKLYETKNGDAVQNYLKAISHYENAIKFTTNDHEIYFHLGKLHHIGVPDIFKKGQKVQGIPPNPQKALHYYTIASQLGNGEALLNIADIYHWGLHGVEPNVQYSKQLYLALRKTGNDYLKGIAKDRILQIKEEEGSVIGSGVEAGNFGNQFNEAFSNYGETQLDEDFDVDLDSKNGKVDELIEHLNLPAIMKDDPDIDGKQELNPHNVTDHVIENTIHQTWSKLKTSTPILFNVEITFRDVKRWILAQREEDKKRDALLTLNEIAKSMSQSTYEDSREIEALVLVWNRIHSNVNKDNRNILKQNLFNELAECVEYGEVVCQKGRIARFFDALNTIDPEVRLVPKWGIMEEMKNYALKMKNDALKRAPAHIQDAVNSPFPTPEQVEVCSKLNDKLKRDLIETFHKNYVDSGRMSVDLLKTELKKWINAF